MGALADRIRSLMDRRFPSPLPDRVKERLKRILSWVFWAVMVLLILGVAAWTAANAVGSSRLAGAFASLREGGYDLRLDRLAPPPLPADRNAAPFYNAAFALMVEPEEGDETYELAIFEGFAGLAPEGKAAIRAWLQKNADAFDMVSRARRRPACRFERRYEGYHTLVPELAPVIRLSRALSLNAKAQAEGGSPEAARETLRDLIALAETMRGEPLLVCQLVRAVSVQIAMEALDACVTGETGEADLESWLGVLPDPSVFDGMMERGMRAELAQAAEIVSAPGASTRRAIYRPNSRPGAMEWVETLLQRPFMKMDGARCLLLLRRASELCRGPYYAETAGDLASFGGEPDRGARWLHPVTSMLLPSIARARERQASLQARIAVVRAGLEFELARLRTGRYPEATEVIDPFTGRPLAYRPAEGRLSSVRPDGAPHPEDETLSWALRRRP